MKSKLNWCKGKGVKLISPNIQLSEKYIEAADETLSTLNLIKNSKIWAPTLVYYFRYFLALSIITKVGIKSDVHSCTIEIIKFFDTKITNDLYKHLVDDKILRTENQYYLKGNEFNINLDKLKKQLFEIKLFLLSLSRDEFIQIRKIISSQKTNH